MYQLNQHTSQRHIAKLETTSFSFSGTEVGFAIANYDDCKRFHVCNKSPVWGQHWVKEKYAIENAHTIGVLNISAEGNFFEIFHKIHQPHPFHNLIIISHKLVPWHIRTRVISIEKLNLNNNELDQVLCFRGIQFLSKKEFEHFFKQIAVGLRPSGTIALNFAILMNFTPDVAKTFSTSPFLKKLNSLITAPEDLVPLKKIMRLVPGLTLADSSSLPLAMADQDFLEKFIINSSQIIRHNYEDLFLSVYSSEEFAQLKATEGVVVTNAGLFMRNMGQ